MISLKYRSDIDGLRAVAVLGVVIYHAFPWMLPGGFTGVDIFFVISGYLISGILYKGHNQGNFSFSEFYARRIRRLFPALITVLLLCLGYGWVVLLPDEYQQLGKHVAAGTLFIQNFVFWQESGYFDTAANLKPLLHLWSLAVEEQFYIFFPPLLIVLWKKPRILVPAMLVLLVASMIGNLVMSVQNSSSDFFLTPYRAWEFLGGSLLAWWHYDRGHEEEVPLHRNALSVGGAILLILGMIVIHKGDAYPGWRALLPVAGTLMLMEGGRGAWINRSILSNPAVVWVGLISYPLYLFHWPALSFVHIVKGEDPKPVYIVDALIVSLILSTLTYYFIEKKIRHHKSRWTIPLLVGAFLTTGLAGALAWRNVIHVPARSAAVTKIRQAVQDSSMLDGFEWIDPGARKLLYYRIGGTGKQTILLGDSNIQQYGARMVEVLKQNHGDSRGATLISAGGCAPIPGLQNPSKTGLEDLMPFFEEALATNPKIDRVVLAALWHIYFLKEMGYSIHGIPLSTEDGKKEVAKQFGRLVHDLTAQGKKVTVVMSIPTGKNLAPKDFFKRGFNGRCTVVPATLTKEEFLRENGAILQQIATVAKENGAEVIDPLDYLCKDGICIRENEDGPIRYDGNHLRPGYVREHVKYLDETVAP